MIIGLKFHPMVISIVKDMQVYMDNDSLGVSIYCDTGADISKMKAFTWCKFYQFPYDSPDRPKKPLLLAQPSAAQWRDCHAAWKEFKEITWADFVGSSLYPEIETIIGKGPENRRDVLHFDSAYKTKCKIFLTADKGDIWSKRASLEQLTDIKIFYTPLELETILAHLEMLKMHYNPLEESN